MGVGAGRPPDNGGPRGQVPQTLGHAINHIAHRWNQQAEPSTSVMKPGEIKKAPETRMAAPSPSSRPGSWP